jgi:hypothetical protein
MFVTKCRAQILKEDVVQVIFNIDIKNYEEINNVCLNEEINEIVLYGPAKVLEKYQRDLAALFTTNKMDIKIKIID